MITHTERGYTFTRRTDGAVVVSKRQGIELDVIRSGDHLYVIAREWLAEWAT